MNSMRQLGSGLIYALVSVALVVGGLSLALAEGVVKPAPPSTSQPSLTIAPSASAPAPTATVAVSSPTSAAPLSPTPQVLIATATNIGAPTATASLIPRATSTIRIYPTIVACGPYAGWILSYTVQTGDTLFHIATLYRTTVNALQIANCRSTTLIRPGERLWVPNVPTITPGVTVIPTFATSTAVPTEPLTLTPIPNFTETAAPSAPPADTPTPGS